MPAPAVLQSLPHRVTRRQSRSTKALALSHSSRRDLCVALRDSQPREWSTSRETLTLSPSSLPGRMRLGTGNNQPARLSHHTLVDHSLPSTDAVTGTRPNGPLTSGAHLAGTLTNVQAAGPSHSKSCASKVPGWSIPAR